MARARAAKASEAAAARPRLLAPADLDSTKSKILEAAYRRLAQEGYAALSMREIAKDAGVNHALINYHFRTKDQLVIAVLDEANRQLLERQHRMYGAPIGFAEKWKEARRFYAIDLASGFVRVQAELWAASMSNPGLREKFVPRILAWKELVLGGVREAFKTLEACGVVLPAPFSADVVATWITEFWLGMEFADLIGIRERQIGHNAALDAIEGLLEKLDAQARKRAKTLGAPVREGYVERGGVKSWYAVWGDSGPWIAFAPIFQITHSQMLKMTVPYLSHHFRVVAMDGRGNGRSDRPSDADAYSFDAYYDDFLAVLDAAGADRVAVIGVSATAMTALRLAAE